MKIFLAKSGLLANVMKNFGDYAQGGKYNYVNFWVPEKPEKLIPQNAAALGGTEKDGAKNLSVVSSTHSCC